MVLTIDIVVMTVDHRIGDREGRQMPGERGQYQAHHLLAILARRGLHPRDGGHLVIEMLGPLGQIREIPIGDLDHPAFHVAPGKLPMVAPMPACTSGIAATGMRRGFGLERLEDVILLVCEIEYEGARLTWRRTIEPREGLHRLHTGQPLDHIQSPQQGFERRRGLAALGRVRLVDLLDHAGLSGDGICALPTGLIIPA